MPKYHIRDHVGRTGKAVCGLSTSNIANNQHPVSCVRCCRALGFPRVTYRGVLGMGAGRFDTMPWIVEFWAHGEWQRVSDLPVSRSMGDGHYRFGMLGFEPGTGDPEVWVRTLQEASQGYTLYVYQRPRPGSGFGPHMVMEYAALRVPDDLKIGFHDWPRFELGQTVERLVEAASESEEEPPARQRKAQRKRKKPRARAKTVAKPTITVYDRILAGDIIEDL